MRSFVIKCVFFCLLIGLLQAESEDHRRTRRTERPPRPQQTERPPRPQRTERPPRTQRTQRPPRTKASSDDKATADSGRIEAYINKTLSRVYCRNSYLTSDAFDDQYEGCTEDMETLVINKILNEEKSSDREFAEAWDVATSKWLSVNHVVPGGFRDEYGIAVLVFSNRQSPVYTKFNDAVKQFGSDPSTFKYNALHFFLTRAVRFLRSNSLCKPWSVYGGIHNYPASEFGSNIRFGQFLSTFTDKQVAEKSGEDVFFTFTSCFGANIKDITQVKDEILIPMDEVFQVTSSDSYNNYVLKTTRRRCHYYNCYYLRGVKSLTCKNSPDSIDVDNNTEEKPEETPPKLKQWEEFAVCGENPGPFKVSPRPRKEKEHNKTKNRKNVKSSKRTANSATQLKISSVPGSAVLFGFLYVISILY
ncbi:ecto-ADP-ribosyltransferase 5-like [Discoglossus pictus]